VVISMLYTAYPFILLYFVLLLSSFLYLLGENNPIPFLQWHKII
jgi:hypothetical protein